ncbi:hypothetical protein GCM10009525_88480 [Streptosporangium amethystogenes subsp. fukuiense]
MLLGIPSNSPTNFAYPTLTVYGATSQKLQLSEGFLTVWRNGSSSQRVPQPRKRNACRLSHAYGLA